MELIRHLHTRRCIIRPFESGDEPAFVEFMTDPTATRYLLFPDDQKTEEGARSLLNCVIDSYLADHPIHSYAITLHNGVWIGSCGVSEVSAGGIWECYYSLLPKYWGHGYATETTAALLGHCFEDPSVCEVRAYMSPDNERSSGVAARLGMTDLGIRRYPAGDHCGRVFSMTKAHHRN